MKQKMKTGRKLLSFLLALAMIVGLMPGMSLTAYADDPYASIKNTTTVITFDGKSWYLTDYDDTTVTLLAKECVDSSKYNENGSFVEYSSNPTVKTAVDDWYNHNITADAQTAVSGDRMFLLTIDEANAITNAEVRKDATAYGGGWWLCSQGTNDADNAAVVNGESGLVSASGIDVDLPIGVRPALKLNLSSVIFSSDTKTFSLKQTIAAENVTVTYGDKDKKVSASVTKPATSGGAISYTVKTGSEDFIAVDSTTGALTIKKVPSDGRAYVIVTAAESGYYGKTTKEVTVTINKANAAPATVTANNCTYDGAEKPLVTVTGTVTGGTMQYALGTKNAATGTYSASIPTATNAGTYYVWYKVIGDNDHKDSNPECITITIAPAENKNQSGTDKEASGSKSNTNTNRDEKTTENKSNMNSNGGKKTTAKDIAAAKAVREKIRAIGTVTYTEECKAKIDAARKAYNKLTFLQKSLVTNYKTLTDAEKKYDELKEEPGKEPENTGEKETPKEDKITISKAPAGVKAAAKKNKVTVSWKKIKKTNKTKALREQIKSVQVQCSTDPTFTENVRSRQVGKNRTKVGLKLQGSTTYYVRVRYLGSDGVSNWSKVKRVKMK